MPDVIFPAKRPARGFWYLATPYTRFPGGTTAAYQLAAEITGELMKAGVPVFSPIVHTHPVAAVAGLQDASHEFWMSVDQPMMDAAIGLIMVTAPSWEKSRGMAQELDTFHAAGKRVLWMHPGQVAAVGDFAREVM